MTIPTTGTSQPTPSASEHNEQAAFVDHVLWMYQNDSSFLRPLFFAVPNGAYLGRNGRKQWAKLRAEGATPGVADFLYLQPRGDYHYLAMEFKRPSRYKSKQRGLTDEQVEFIEAVNLAGAFSTVCYGAGEAIEVFTWYMSLEAKMNAAIESTTSPLTGG